jgi:hypothetical protein
MGVLNLYRGQIQDRLSPQQKFNPTMPNQDVLAQAVGGQSVQKSVHVHLPTHLPTFRTIQAFRQGAKPPTGGSSDAIPEQGQPAR